MHKLFILLLFCVVYTTTHSQNTTIVYDSYSDNHISTRMPLYLHIDVKNNKAINELVPSELVDVTNSDDSNYQSLVNYTKNTENIYHYYDGNKNTYFTIGSIGSNYFLVNDSLPNIQWKITAETKTIMDIDCVKAVAHFRGRKWIAWFTTQFPYNIGPSTYQGLPGVIMEIYDETKKYQIVATAIKLNSDLYQQAYDNYTRTTKPTVKEITKQEYVTGLDEYIEANIQRSKQRHKNATIIRPERTERELIYEWEEEK